MEENKSNDLVPFGGSEGTKKIPIKKICVKVYLNENQFAEYAKLAEDAGTRPRGLKLFRQKAHGFAWERVANTKGIVKLIKKKAIPQWKEGERERIERRVRLEQEAKELGLKVER